MPDENIVKQFDEISAPAVLTKTNRELRGTNFGRVQTIDILSNRWLDAEQNSRARMYEALESFVDIDGGSWRQEDRTKALQQKRHLVSMNVAKQKMETLHGSLSSEEFDYAFTPLDVDDNTLSKNIKHWYFADKEQYNYSKVDSDTLMSGLLHAGTSEIYIDYKIRRSGAIAFRHVNDGFVLKDPYWQDGDVHDWRRAVKHGWLTAREIRDKYDTNDPEILAAAEREDLSTYRYESSDDVNTFREVPKRWGSRYLIIEYRWLETLKTTRLHMQMPTGEWLPLPLKVSESEVRGFMGLYGVESWMNVKEFPYEDDILYMTTVCPQLSRTAILSDGKHEIQCGMIGYFRFSSMRHQGIEKGMYEYALDTQRSFNFRQSKIEDVLASAGSGGVAVDKNKIGGVKGLREYRDNKTDPSFILGVDGDPTNVASKLPVNEVPESLFQDVSNLLNVFDRVLPVTPALEGMGPGEESGILFELRHAVTKLGTLRLFRNWQQFLMDQAEAWYNQSQITYKGTYKKVKCLDRGGEVEFNRPTYRNGRKVYLNDVSTLPRAKVNISLMKSSPTEQLSQRLQLAQLNKIFSAHPDLFKSEIRATNHELLKTMQLDPEQKEYFDMLFEIQKQIDLIEEFDRLSRLKADIAANASTQAQAEIMLQQLNERFQEMQPQPQGQVPESINPAVPALPGAGATPSGGPQPEPPSPGTEPGQPVETSRGVFVP